MAQRGLLLLGGLAFVAICARWLVSSMAAPSLPTVDISDAQVAARSDAGSVGLCPWRNPDSDRVRFFPDSDSHREENLLLSGYRQEMTRRLGRSPTAEENAMQIHRILQKGKPVGAVIARRVRGESGVIELVLAVGSDGRVLDAKLQRLREPETSAAILRSEEWLGAFRGKSAASEWKPGKDLPAVPAAARVSAEAIAEGARVAVILYSLGNRLPLPDHH